MMAVHGTRSNYVMGCRCAPCREANAVNSQAQREKDHDLDLAAAPEFHICACGRRFTSPAGLSVHRGSARHWGTPRVIEAPEMPTVECEKCGRVITAVGVYLRRHREACYRQPRVDVTRTEAVTAERVRPSDLLIGSDPHLGPLEVQDVKKSTTHVALKSHNAWWYVPVSCKFVRVKVSHRIDTRPDLRSNA